MDENQEHYSIKKITEIKENILEGLKKDGSYLIENIDQYTVYRILKGLGKLFKQELGEEHLVEYKDGFDNFRYSKSMNEIGPHSEYPYHEIPPKIQVLYCIKPSDCQGGQTYTCNTKKFLKTLSEEELRIITSAKIDFRANTDLKDFRALGKAFPILTENPDGSYVFRFSHNLFYYGDVNANMYSEKKGHFLAKLKNRDLQGVIEKFLEYFDSNRKTWKIPKNGLLLWNNHNLVHSRASYTDRSRKLARYLIV